MVGDFFTGTLGFFDNTGGGVDLRSSKFSKLLRNSEFVLSIFLRAGFSTDDGGVSIVTVRCSNDSRWAATLPAIIPVSLSESFEPKLSFRCEFVVDVLLDDLLLISTLDDNGGRSGFCEAVDDSFMIAGRKNFQTLFLIFQFEIICMQ